MADWLRCIDPQPWMMVRGRSSFERGDPLPLYNMIRAIDDEDELRDIGKICYDLAGDLATARARVLKNSLNIGDKVRITDYIRPREH